MIQIAVDTNIHDINYNWRLIKKIQLSSSAGLIDGCVSSVAMVGGVHGSASW